MRICHHLHYVHVILAWPSLSTVCVYGHGMFGIPVSKCLTEAWVFSSSLVNKIVE